MAESIPVIYHAVLGVGEAAAQDRPVVNDRAQTVLRPQLNDAPDCEASHEALALEDAIWRVNVESADPLPQTLGAEAARIEFGTAGNSVVPALSFALPSRRQFALNTASLATVSAFKTMLQLILLPVMARLLGPTAYGIYSLAFPTVMFFVMLGDAGLGMSLSREDEQNRVVWSTAFWTLLGTCTVLAVGVSVAGHILAHLSGQPSLTRLMAFLSLALILLAVSLPADARLLRRGNMLFHSVSDLLGSITGAGVALILAFKGAGAWALAVQYITAFSLRAIILNAAAWSPPDFVYDFASLRIHISAGGALLITRLGEFGGKLAENAVFGYVFGTTSLGSYTLANQVSRFACDAVTNPVTGAFYAQILRENDAEVVLLHIRVARILLIILLPATTFMAVAAPSVFSFALGEKWIGVAPFFQAIVVAYAVATVAWLNGQIMLKHGMTSRSAKVVLGCSAVRVAVVGTGLWLSPVQVAWLVGSTYILQAVAMTLAVPHGLGVRLGALFLAIRVPTIATVLCAAISAVLICNYPEGLASTLICITIGAAIYLVLIFTCDGKAIRQDIVGLVRTFKRRRT